MKKTLLAVLAAGVLMLGVTGMAHATIYSENFNASGFISGGVLNTGAEYSDNWDPTHYYHVANSYNGWSFTGGAFYATNGVGDDGAILLNENAAPTTASKMITGLTAGANYILQFNVWGDNRPGSLYGLNVTISNSPVLAISGVSDLAAGYYNGSGGILETISFQATSDSALLLFTQNTLGGEASPIIDNVQVDSAPVPEPGTMMLLGFGMLGLAVYGKRRMNKEA